MIELRNNLPIEWGFESNAPKFFLRLKFTDQPTDNPFTDDFDADHVTNFDELLAATDPFATADSDSDGLPDDWEIKNFANLSSTAADDPDSDGLTNLQEFTYYSDPTDFGNRAQTDPRQDSDGNGLADWWEMQNFGHLGNDGSMAIALKGGLTLQQIFDHDLDLAVSSTVGDDIPDSWKIAHGLNPADSTVANQDPDEDGLNNGDEFASGTNPEAGIGWDTDGDGIADGSDLHPLIADPFPPLNLRVAIPSQDAHANPIDWTAIEVRWDVPPSGADGYRIESRHDSDLWTEIASLPTSATSYPVGGLVAHRHYQFRVSTLKNVAGQEIKSPFAQTTYEVPLSLQMSVKRSGLNRVKHGFAEWDVSSSPPKYYLKMTTTSTRISSDYGSDWEESEDGRSTFVETIIPSTHSRQFSCSDYLDVYDYSRIPTAGDSTVKHAEDTRSYSWLDQERSKLNLVKKSAGNTQTTFFSSNTVGTETTTKSSAKDADYFLTGTFLANGGSPVWTGTDFDLTLGTVTWDGGSHLTTWKLPPTDTSDVNASATADANAIWTGSKTITLPGGNTTTTSLNSAPWSSAWSGEDWLTLPQQIVTTPTSVSTSYHYAALNHSYTATVTNEITDEYLTNAFVADTIADFPDYPSTWENDWLGWGSTDGWQSWFSPDFGIWVAERDLSSTGENLAMSRMKYQFHASPSAPRTLKWSELFVPHDDPATPDTDESAAVEILRECTWAMNPGETESPEFEIDPSGDERNGYYTVLIEPLSITVSGIGEAGKNISGDDAAPGKVVLINDRDADDDGIPDFADGFNRNHQIAEDNESSDAFFTPVGLRFNVFDLASAKVKFTYDASDPKAITTSPTDPYVLPATGKIRLWLKEAGQPRNADSPKQGGDFIVSGEEYTLAELGIASYTYLTVYVEAVKISGAVADIPIRVDVAPSGSLGYRWSDQLRFTGVKMELLSSPTQVADYSTAAAFSPASFRSYETLDDPTGLALPRTALFKVKITDPRNTLTSCTVYQDKLTITRIDGGPYETVPFLAVTPGTHIPVPFANFHRVPIASGSHVIEYNPPAEYSSVKFPDLPKEMQQVYSDMQKVAKQFHDAGWQPPADWNGDDGVFGDATHGKMTDRYIGQRGRLTDLWLDAEGKVIAYNRGYNWVPGSRVGTTQIDLLLVRGGYKPVVGKLLDRSRLIAPVDFKSSNRVKWGKLNAGLAERVLQHTGLPLWAPVCEHRYNFTRGAMEAGKNMSRATKLLKGVNRALPLAMLLSLPSVADAMDKAVADAQTFLLEYERGIDGQSGSQLTMALSVREVLSLTSLSPLQEIGNYYATIALSVLDAGPLFEHDPEYDPD